MFDLSTYKKLRLETGQTIFRRDLLSLCLLSLLLSIPFWIFQHANFFSKDGFVDRIGVFSSVLTDLYVAGLLAVSSMSNNSENLDKQITVGKVAIRMSDWDVVLTRRQYVCYFFGYLAFVSLCLAIFSHLIVILSQPIRAVLPFECSVYMPFCVSVGVIRGLLVCLYGAALSTFTLTTIRALHYLVERLYYKPMTRE